MKTILKFVIISSLLISFFGSCSIQKRRYSSGYHVTWKHSKKTKLNVSPNKKLRKPQVIANQNTVQEINPKLFSSHYPKSAMKWVSPEITKKTSLPLTGLEPTYKNTFHQPFLDTITTLTPAEVDENYFVNKNGKKKKYRRVLKNSLTFGGIGLMIFTLGLWPIAVIGLAALVIGIALPKPNKRSLVVSNSQLVQSKNDDKAMAAVGISIGLVILILVVGVIILFGLLFVI